MFWNLFLHSLFGNKYATTNCQISTDPLWKEMVKNFAHAYRPYFTNAKACGRCNSAHEGIVVNKTLLCGLHGIIYLKFGSEALRKRQGYFTANTYTAAKWRMKMTMRMLYLRATYHESQYATIIHLVRSSTSPSIPLVFAMPEKPWPPFRQKATLVYAQKLPYLLTAIPHRAINLSLQTKMQHAKLKLSVVHTQQQSSVFEITKEQSGLLSKQIEHCSEAGTHNLHRASRVTLPLTNIIQTCCWFTYLNGEDMAWAVEELDNWTYNKSTNSFMVFKFCESIDWNFPTGCASSGELNIIILISGTSDWRQVQKKAGFCQFRWFALNLHFYEVRFWFLVVLVNFPHLIKELPRSWGDHFDPPKDRSMILQEGSWYTRPWAPSQKNTTLGQNYIDTERWDTQGSLRELKTFKLKNLKIHGV